MRPAEFAPEKIIEAGHELKAAGRNITGFALRQRVGGGNPSRLKQVWDEHINSQAVTTAEPVADLPIEVAEQVAVMNKMLSERLAALAVELNDKAVKAAERRVAEVIRTAGEQREQAERELADAGATVEDLESKLDQAKGDAVELEERLDKVLADRQALEVDLAKAHERAQMNEKAAELLRSELGEHKKAAQDTATERDRARDEAAELRGKVDALQAQVANLMQTLTARLGP